MTYVSDVEAAFDLATRDAAEVLSTDADGLTLRILSHKNAAAVMTQIQLPYERIAELIIKKQRNGPTGVVAC